MLAAEPGWWLQVLSPWWCRPGGGWTLTEQQGGPPRTAPHTPPRLELVISVLTSALSSVCSDGSAAVTPPVWNMLAGRHLDILTRDQVPYPACPGPPSDTVPTPAPVVWMWIVDIKFGGARPQPFVPGYPGSWVLVQLQTRVCEYFTITFLLVENSGTKIITNRQH